MNTNNSDNNNKVKRKQRTVTNGYIDIDNVTVEPGEGFLNWIEITKQKLKERECKLMSVRISTLQNIINEQCKIFEGLNSSTHQITVNEYHNIISSQIVDECLNKLYLSLQLWNGVNLTKTKKSVSTFRKYFVIGKCWFDQKKKNILSPDFWIKFFFSLQQFTSNTAGDYFNHQCPDLQKMYAQHLLFQIISGIFSGQLHFAATKAQPLIPCGILKDSYPMKEYLNNLHPSLNIEQLIKQRKQNSNGSIKNVTAKEILEMVNKQLLSLNNSAHIEFQKHLQEFWNGNNVQNNNHTLNDLQNSEPSAISAMFSNIPHRISSIATNNHNPQNQQHTPSGSTCSSTPTTESTANHPQQPSFDHASPNNNNHQNQYLNEETMNTMNTMNTLNYQSTNNHQFGNKMIVGRGGIKIRPPTFEIPNLHQQQQQSVSPYNHDQNTPHTHSQPHTPNQYPSISNQPFLPSPQQQQQQQQSQEQQTQCIAAPDHNQHNFNYNQDNTNTNNNNNNGNDNDNDNNGGDLIGDYSGYVMNDLNVNSMNINNNGNGNGNGDMNQNYGGYGASHSSSQSVISQRYNPMNSMHSPFQVQPSSTFQNTVNTLNSSSYDMVNHNKSVISSFSDNNNVQNYNFNQYHNNYNNFNDFRNDLSDLNDHRNNTNISDINSYYQQNNPQTMNTMNTMNSMNTDGMFNNYFTNNFNSCYPDTKF